MLQGLHLPSQALFNCYKEMGMGEISKSIRKPYTPPLLCFLTISQGTLFTFSLKEPNLFSNRSIRDKMQLKETSANIKMLNF